MPIFLRCGQYAFDKYLAHSYYSKFSSKLTPNRMYWGSAIIREEYVRLIWILTLIFLCIIVLHTRTRYLSEVFLGILPVVRSDAELAVSIYLMKIGSYCLWYWCYYLNLGEITALIDYLAILSNLGPLNYYNLHTRTRT